MPQPNIDPAIYQELVQQQGGEQMPEGYGQQVAPQATPQIAPQAPQQVAPQMVQPEQQAPQGDELEEAKKLLGLDEAQQKMMEMEQKLKEIEMEKTKQAVSSKYPDIPFDLVEKEIEKVKEINPQLAETMLTNPDAMELAFRAVQASIKPQEKPDNILEGEGGGAGDDTIVDKIKNGEADDFTLGEYILNSKK